MHFSNIALAAGLAATAAAAPLATADIHSLETRQSGSLQQVVYWGQNNQENDLADYCTSTEGVDVLVLAFVYEYGNGQIPYGNFGEYCVTSQECTDLENSIATCKAAGKKIFVSLGGAVGSYSLASTEDAQGIAQDLWDSYANPSLSSNSSAIRPFGQQIIDGFDLDIEASAGNQYYPDMINKLRSLFATDSANTYKISGAPQCPIPEPNMGAMIAAAKFDMLFIQFYNNPYCSAYQLVRPDGNPSDAFNFDDWYNYTQSGASAGAQLFVGLPASTLGATGTASGAQYYLQPSELVTLVNQYKTHPGFSGVMLWDAHQSDTINENGCHYDGVVRKVLDTGASC